MALGGAGPLDSHDCWLNKNPKVQQRWSCYKTPGEPEKNAEFTIEKLRVGDDPFVLGPGLFSKTIVLVP